MLRISAKDFVTVIKQIFPKTLSLIEKAPEGITDVVKHFLQNKREIEIQSKLDSMDYSNKIKSITSKNFKFDQGKRNSKY